ncbi:MAG: hypothetical protein V4654_10630 [Bdellovibrionota bacterium]
MKSISQGLKTFAVGLTLVYGVNSVSFAAEILPGDKFLNKAQLMELLSKGGLHEGTQLGVSTEGNACELTISTKEGTERVSLKSSADAYSQELIFEEDLSDILFRVRETANGLSINQDFSDSYQDVKIEKISSREVRATFHEYIAGDERTLTCSFK